MLLDVYHFNGHRIWCMCQTHARGVRDVLRQSLKVNSFSIIEPPPYDVDYIFFIWEAHLLGKYGTKGFL